MQLAMSTWCDIEDYLRRSRALIVPIGSMEQHGPTGLIGTDALCAELIAARAGDAAGILIGPTFNVGCAQHHLGFPGTLTLRPSTMIAALVDWCASLVRHGFERLYFLNGHGGNTATLNAAFAEIYAQRSLDAEAVPATLRLRARSWWELPAVMDTCRSLHPRHDGVHATASEIALTWAAYPEQERRAVLRPRVAPSGPFTDARDYRERFPDGRIGSDPSQATAENGEKILAAAASALIEDFQRFAAS
jgi:creatinine amidohydrolase